jgi:hypothetical protein
MPQGIIHEQWVEGRRRVLIRVVIAALTAWLG